MDVSSPPPVSHTDPAAPRPVSLGQALRYWLKLGFISFGGPAGQIALMHRDLVDDKRWISERRFLHALNYCMLLPGPEAQQLATYIGWLMHRTWGGVLAGVLFVLPSMLLLIGLSWIYMAHGDQPLVAGLFYGIKPAVTAIVLQAAWRIGSRALKNAWLWGIAGASFLAISVFNVPFPLIVLGAALAGAAGGRLRPGIFSGSGGHVGGKASGAHPPARIDDHTPTPPHARFAWSRLATVLAAGALLWALPMGVLTSVFGWNHSFTQMGWFFTKAALLTFGGAYAVLPYVVQGAVVQHGWLSATQMMDGLALGETTPGPLIMIVAFVAFVGGYGHALLGPELTFAAGALAATLVTWFTFLPSFIFILAGGPLVESTHGKLGFTAPLTAITAAVVGVIANLALFFALHILWPAGRDHPLDGTALLIAAGAALALMRFKATVMTVIGGCALTGLLVRTMA